MNGPLMTLRTAVILALGCTIAASTAVLTILTGSSTVQALLAAGAVFGTAVPALHCLIATDRSEADRG
ncbi:hypothetical protein GCM10023347_07250 [Streptomyces chumphonensis]|uniref:Uncharacterized protein n=1 Tax=Streptomyces chumphonensis TaxID=1214925 RepID=A0A927F3I0_9ACTN|nr:hypothetical protein [Streptomyces chumphonensis]MBD3934878.1 hypothetical protein [Streptomyces chumphonensis]